MAKTYTISQKMSGTGTIHDIASDQFDRDIVFGKDGKYAVVIAAYYGGKGYTSHKTAKAAIAKSRSESKANYSHTIIDIDGNEYCINGDSLERIN
jgi:hypothetical protein